MALFFNVSFWLTMKKVYQENRSAVSGILKTVAMNNMVYKKYVKYKANIANMKFINASTSCTLWKGSRILGVFRA